jgi:hypothetical protein
MAMRIFISAVIVLTGLSAFAQETRPPGPPRPVAQIEAMAKLAHMAGEWNGEGWMDMGARRATFRGGERVQSKLDGSVMLVEGSFFSTIGEREVPVHTTLGVIWFDPASKKYRFNTWLATGTAGQHELELLESGWRWQLETPRGGTMRYTTKLTEDEWLEIGERSTDGSTWTQFFEMKLKKSR